MKKLVLSLFILCTLTVSVFAQERTVTGTVTSSEDGSPIAEATVKVKEIPSLILSTGTNGKFSLKVPANGKTLVITYLGYVPQEVTIPANNVVNVRLVSESKSLSEVIVTGLGVSRQAASLGYSAQKVNGEDLTFAKNTDVSTALAGKIAGVQLIGSPSSAFGNADIIIRGVKGLGMTSPLFVVDGTPTDQENINMDNVENISVLKGAGATAVWGNRGQNGVVLITTKKGTRNGKPSIEVNLGASSDRMALLPEYQNEYAGGSKSGYTNKNSLGTGYLDDEGFYIFNYDPSVHPASWAGFQGQRMLEYGNDESWGPKISGQQYRPYYSWFPGADFGKLEAMTAQPNNVNDFFQNGRTLNNSIAFTGGTDVFNFRISYANQNRTLVLPGSKRDNNQIGFSASYDLSPKFTVSTDISYRVVAVTGSPAEGYRNDGLNITQNFNQWFQRQLNMDRLKNYALPDGTFQSWNIGDPNGASDASILKPQYWDSPYFTLERNYGTSKGNNIFGNVGLTYKITSWLSFDNRIRLNYNQNRSDFRIGSGGLQLDSYSLNQNNRSEVNYESKLNLRKTLGDFSLDAGLGINVRSNKFNELKANTEGGLTFPNFHSIEGSVARPTVEDDYSAKEVRSIISNVSIGYKSFLYVDATLRNDWSSALPISDNSYLYPSISTSFIFTELLSNSELKKYLSFGKVRASFAQVGSDLGFNQVNIALNNGSIFDGNPASTIGNQYRSGMIKPSLTKSFEVGAELKFFRRIGVDFAWYKDDNVNQIISLTLPGSSGFATAQINAGNIQSKGWELSFTGNPVKGKSFNWNMGLNFAKNISFVKELSPLQKTVVAATTWNNTRLENREGAEWGMIVGRAYQRDPNGKIIVGANGIPLYNLNVDQGSILPKFTGGFYNSFNYKGIDLSFSIDFQKDGKYFSSTRMFNLGAGLSSETVGVNDKGHDWRDFPGSYTLAGGNVGNGGIKIPGVFANGTPNNRYIASKNYFYTSLQNDASNFVINASYIKLREVRLGYQIPKSVLGNIPVKSLNLGFTVNNAWLISAPSKKYGVDPSELESSWTEGGQLSSTRSFGLNLKASF